MDVQMSLEHLVLDGMDGSYRARLLNALEQELTLRFSGSNSVIGDLQLEGLRLRVDPSRPPEVVARQLASELHFSAHVHAASVGRLAPGGLRAAPPTESGPGIAAIGGDT